ncbi:hypothetical protein JAAARDRAFT_694414 [Jaapia argillacea MUCL 33604]|uniref:Uncharacterized protein n=1 Tax=Jaapia argillacea MUCL 33604 TaxID=933084 RepID=A0A067QI30_9AGAM|nr:hypothetical protein JAAARDRAFT_694414 [Jaapia argillacea MUCL 33604]
MPPIPEAVTINIPIPVGTKRIGERMAKILVDTRIIHIMRRILTMTAVDAVTNTATDGHDAIIMIAENAAAITQGHGKIVIAKTKTTRIPNDPHFGKTVSRNGTLVVPVTRIMITILEGLVEDHIAQPLLHAPPTITQQCLPPNIPLQFECTVKEEPAGWNDEGWAFWSSGARRNLDIIPPDANSVNKRICRGVWRCGCRNQDEYCRFVWPKTNINAFKKQAKEICPICHETLTLIPCDAFMIAYDYVRPDGVRRLVRHHQGIHKHPKPPTKTLSAAEREALDHAVQHNPQATALQHRVGPERTQVPITSINPILSDPRKARYEVDKSKVRVGLSDAPSSDNKLSVTKLIELLKSTPFMREELLADAVSSWGQEHTSTETSRHGIITDGSHDFFMDGVLLSSFVYSTILLRWVPVLYTWIGNLDAEHHIPHFLLLITAIAGTVAPGIEVGDYILSNILNYSQAQRKGFVEAFVNFMVSRIPGWASLNKDAQTAQRKSIYNRAEQLIKGHNTKPEQFLQAADQIHTGFPEEIETLYKNVRNGAVQRKARDDKLPAVRGIRWHPNDGRAPDTRTLLTLADEAEAKLAQGTSSTSIEARLSALSVKISGTTEKSPDDDFPPKPVMLKGKGKGKGKTSGKLKVTKAARKQSGVASSSTVQLPPILPSAIGLQSYTWSRNSCFIDSSLELLYWGFWIDRLSSPTGSSLRSKWSITTPGVTT